MRLHPDEARRRLEAHDHGVLCTVHPRRGVDPVPVVYVLDDDHVGVPIDRVKAKSTTRLQRERNLDTDPWAALLVEHWDPDDWSRLWWVRAELHHQADPAPGRTAALADRLAAHIPQYRERPFARILVLRLGAVTGWTAEAG